jgi:DNA polymerase-1
VPELLGDELPTFGEVTGGRFFDELDPSDPETVRYACADADYALRLYHRFNRWFDAYLPAHRFIAERVESPTAVCCGLMKYNGLLTDRDAMIRKQGEAAARLIDLQEKYRGVIGDVSIGATPAPSVQGLPVPHAEPAGAQDHGEERRGRGRSGAGAALRVVRQSPAGAYAAV